MAKNKGKEGTISYIVNIGSNKETVLNSIDDKDPTVVEFAAQCQVKVGSIVSQPYTDDCNKKTYMVIEDGAFCQIGTAGAKGNPANIIGAPNYSLKNATVHIKFLDDKLPHKIDIGSKGVLYVDDHSNNVKSGSIEVSIDSDGLLIQTGKYNFGKITMAPNASFQCTIDDIKYSFCSKNNAIIDSKKLDSFVNNLQNNDVEAELGMLTSFDEIPEEIQVIGIDCSCYIL